jgi:hypothetical protein
MPVAVRVPDPALVQPAYRLRLRSSWRTSLAILGGMGSFTNSLYITRRWLPIARTVRRRPSARVLNSGIHLVSRGLEVSPISYLRDALGPGSESTFARKLFPELSNGRHCRALIEATKSPRTYARPGASVLLASRTGGWGEGVRLACGGYGEGLKRLPPSFLAPPFCPPAPRQKRAPGHSEADLGARGQGHRREGVRASQARRRADRIDEQGMPGVPYSNR